MQGAELRKIRLALGLTQQEMAYRLKLRSRITINRYENGKRPIPEWHAEAARHLAVTTRRRR